MARDTQRSDGKGRVLVSACLLGSSVRYDGSAKLAGSVALERRREEGRVVPLCPEVAVGFQTPRPAAELDGTTDGAQVLAGRARVVEKGGRDVTDLYRQAAQVALDEARRHDCRFALLTDGSPSCGSRFVHDGSFSGRRVGGRGATTALLERNGVRVFSEAEIDVPDAMLQGDGHSRW